MPRENSSTSDETPELADVLDVFDDTRGPVITSADVADQLDCPAEVGREQLRRLYNRGEVDKRKTGGVVVWWRSDWVQVNTNTAVANEDSLNAAQGITERATLDLPDPSEDDATDGTGRADRERREFTQGKTLDLAEPTADDETDATAPNGQERREFTEGKTLDLADPTADDEGSESVTEAIAAVETPGDADQQRRRERALRDVYDYLEAHGEGQRREFADLLGDDVGYASFASWWSNYVQAKDALAQLPGIEAPERGEHTWRHTGTED